MASSYGWFVDNQLVIQVGPVTAFPGYEVGSCVDILRGRTSDGS